MPETDEQQAWGVRLGGRSGPQASENIHQRFLELLQSTPIALSQLWTVEISVEAVQSVISRSATDGGQHIRSFEHSKWLQGTPINDLFANGLAHIGNTYLLLAQSSSVPGDQVRNIREAIPNSGFLGGNVGGGRGDPDSIRITFFETVQSFVDFVIRPWMLMVGHKSLKDRRLRHNISVVEWYKDPKTQTIIRPKQKTTLIGAVPISIQIEELNYTSKDIIHRQVDFRYDSYYITDFPSWDDKLYTKNDSRGIIHDNIPLNGSELPLTSVSNPDIIDQWTGGEPPISPISVDTVESVVQLTPGSRIPSAFRDPSLRIPSAFRDPSLRIPSAFRDPSLRIPSAISSGAPTYSTPAVQLGQVIGSPAGGTRISSNTAAPTAFTQSRNSSFRNIGGRFDGVVNPDGSISGAGQVGVQRGSQNSDTFISNDGANSMVRQTDRVRGSSIGLGAIAPIPLNKPSQPVFRLGLGGIDQQTTSQSTSQVF